MFFDVHWEPCPERKKITRWAALISRVSLCCIPRRRGGWWVGYGVAEPLLRLFNFWPTLVLLAGFILISLVITFNIPLRLVLFANKEERGSFFDRLLGRTPKEEPAYIDERMRTKNIE